MDIIECGNKNGNRVIYFHGAPGTIEECAIFDRHAQTHNLKIVCFDRFSLDKSLDRERYYQWLVAKINILSDGDPIDLIGFSIGAHVALEVSARLQGQVRSIHLVSAAAPIHAGNFIDSMAGGMVFKLAKETPFLFSLLSRFQKFLAFIAPQQLVSMLFFSATGKDADLSQQDDFKRFITPILKHCFQKRIAGYIRDVTYYTAWQGDFSGSTACVRLWHGTEDNWSPFPMSSYLSDQIPGDVRVTAMEGLSHYSCLFEAAPKICAELSAARQG